ncbi:hypothetical protein [uncultured Cytophaga sp.]|uniref:hypothetical protein n=1 Tax=uncultured Cytophaga sp. TaxID=160238 RepID=UPI00262250EE|nr:hypothetical protein [uncultured Cytophaga sp.]
MSKKILILYYSQSGQLTEIVDSISIPLIEAGATIEKITIKPKNDFPFPWTSDTFFDAMPECVLGETIELEAFTFKQERYDLIIFAYQPWFLSPSIPATSALKDTAVKKIMENTPVITLIGARNMWLNSQDKVKVLLKEANAILVGNIALVDKHNNHLSAVSILYWMLSGKKEKYLSIFPIPGVSDSDIKGSTAFGRTISYFLNKESWSGMQDTLIAQNAVVVKANLMFIEQRARKLFSIWANLIKNKSNRKPWVTAYKYYLLIALFIVAPIVIAINEVLFKPFLKKQINEKRKKYQTLN